MKNETVRIYTKMISQRQADIMAFISLEGGECHSSKLYSEGFKSPSIISLKRKGYIIEEERQISITPKGEENFGYTW